MQDPIRDSSLDVRKIPRFKHITNGSSRKTSLPSSRKVSGYFQWDVIPGAGGLYISSIARRVAPGDIVYCDCLHQHHPGDQVLLKNFGFPFFTGSGKFSLTIVENSS